MLAVIYFVAGFLGAIIKDVVQDNRLVIPKYSEGVLLLGFIGGGVVGGIAGVVADASFMNAALAGFVGSSVIYRLAREKTELEKEE